MFVNPPDMTELRQGDVIRDIVFPIARIGKTQFLANPTGTKDGKLLLEPLEDQSGKRPIFHALVQASLCHCVVLSQCCDVQRSKNPPPIGFLLVKLVPIMESMRRNYDILKANGDPYLEGTHSFIHLFWIGIWEELGPIEYVADFGQAMLVVWKDYDATLARKTLQMDDSTRSKFRVKAGAHFGRVTKEDRDAGLEDPYDPQEFESLIQRFRRALRVARGI
jgi:hypothetical protein